MDVIVSSAFVQEWVKAICEETRLSAGEGYLLSANVVDVCLSGFANNLNFIVGVLLSEVLTDFNQNLFGNSVEFIVRVFEGKGTPFAV